MAEQRLELLDLGTLLLSPLLEDDTLTPLIGTSPGRHRLLLFMDALPVQAVRLVRS